MPKKQPETGYCCPLMHVVLVRNARTNQRNGLVCETMLNFKTGHLRDTVIIRFPKAKRGEDPICEGDTEPNAQLAEVNFCPFCGSKKPIKS